MNYWQQGASGTIRRSETCRKSRPAVPFAQAGGLVASEESFLKVGHFKQVAAFRAHLASLGLDLPCDERVLSATDRSPMARPLDVGGFVVGNRWCIHPMEGWDGTTSGEPTEHTLRR